MFEADREAKAHIKAKKDAQTKNNNNKNQPKKEKKGCTEKQSLGVEPCKQHFSTVIPTVILNLLFLAPRATTR